MLTIHEKTILPLHGLARFLAVVGVVSVRFPTAAAAAAIVSLLDGTESDRKPKVSRPLPSLSLVSPDDARFTRHGLLLG
jgi:hypothetical protein